MENKNVSLIEVNINQLNPAKYNPRKNLKRGDEEYNKIKRSIEHFGYVEPIVMNHDNTVISGHQRLKVLKDLGYKQITVVKLNLNSQEEKALNKIKGEWDVDKLKTVIKELDSFDFDITLTGHRDEELLNMDCDVASKYLNKSSGALRKKFIVPPFSILDARQTEWQKRKKQWHKMINSQNGRSDKLMCNGLYSLAMETGANLTGTSVFDPVLCEILINWFCPRGGKIIDPFAGGSMRGLVSSFLDRQYYGNDLSKKQIEANIENYNHIKSLKNLYNEPLQKPNWSIGASQEIDKIIKENDFDMLFTCPPYGDLEVYSDNEKDISNMDYENFLNEYKSILFKSVAKLKENAFIVLVVGEIRDKSGYYRNFIGDTIEIMKQTGANYLNEIILITMFATLAIRAGKQFELSRKVRNTHKKALVFLKSNGDKKALEEYVNSFDKTKELTQMKKSIFVFLRSDIKLAVEKFECVNKSL